MTTNVLIGISAGLGTLVVLLLILLVVRRRGDSSAEERVAEVVASLNARMDALGRELAVALERAEEEGRRSQVLGQLAGSIDLDEVLARILETAGKLSGVDAALVMLPDPHEGKPVVATLGLSIEEAERHAITGPPDGRLARSITMNYTYPDLERDPAGEASIIHGGLAVPLPGETSSGYLTIFTRTPDRTFEEEDVRELEALAVRAGPAIENARRGSSPTSTRSRASTTGASSTRHSLARWRALTATSASWR